MQTGIAPPQGFALSIFRSKIIHSMFGFLAKASAAQDPAGPPPMTATLNLFATASEQLQGYDYCKVLCHARIH